MKFLVAVVTCSILVSLPAVAQTVDPGGELNPDEMSLWKSLDRASRGSVDMVICSQGYVLTKQGNHDQARKLFEACAAQGWTGTMTWMSYMEQNGLGGPEDAEASAEWDRRAAELGDPVAQFNYGLNLLRGYGVEQNEELGRRFVDRAAELGVGAAVELQDGNYDPDVVTPDADEWKFKKRLF